MGKSIMLRKPKGLFKDDSGVVAIEFAMLSVPFIILLMGIVECSVLYGSGIVLEGASAEAGRLIRTGQAQDSADPEALFKEKLCEQVADIIPCDEIQYEVIKMGASFANFDDFAPHFDADGNFVPQGFDAGGSNDVILIRSVYQYTYLVPFIAAIMNGGESASRVMLMSTTVIKNEPFEFGS
jgi:Flp pilus assembly protein TadG